MPLALCVLRRRCTAAGAEFREERALRAAAQRLRLLEVPVRPAGAPRAAATSTAQIAGLRYFNVYGPREAHKGRMASVAFHFFNQFAADGKVKLFEGSGGYGNGEQRRDFVHVDDVVDGEPVVPRAPRACPASSTAAPAARRPSTSVAAATINCGAGHRATPARELAQARLHRVHRRFPPGLKDKYQSFTQADLVAAARGRLSPATFKGVEHGVAAYVNELQEPLRAAS